MVNRIEEWISCPLNNKPTELPPFSASALSHSPGDECRGRKRMTERNSTTMNRRNGSNPNWTTRRHNKAAFSSLRTFCNTSFTLLLHRIWWKVINCCFVAASGQYNLPPLLLALPPFIPARHSHNLWDCMYFANEITNNHGRSRRLSLRFTEIHASDTIRRSGGGLKN